ncbi:MAG: hypothetical protein JXA50_05390 [Deltaproteobacteria bacterium]|nr:hypothetical protein [Deltaproteobacteria bacterium]
MSAQSPAIKISHHPVFLGEDPARIASIQRGELIHRALSLLDHFSGNEDVEKVILQAFALHGVDTMRWNIEKDYLKPLLAVLSLPLVNSWFKPGVLNLREVEIVDAHGAVHRIDRLIIGTEILEVIDFKLGRREEEHRAQVRLYTELVASVFSRSTQGYLLYVDEPAVVAVP